MSKADSSPRSCFLTCLKTTHGYGVMELMSGPLKVVDH